MIIIALVIGAGFALFLFLLLRFANPGVWTHRDILAFIVTCGGAMALTFVKFLQNEVFVRQADRLINELVRERSTAVHPDLGEVLKEIISTQSTDITMNSAGVLVVLLSLGLVIGVRTFKGRLPGGAEFEMGGGEGAHSAAAQGAKAAAKAADDKADAIAEEGLDATGDGELPERDRIK
jgi:hypothetical protein